MKRNRFKTKKHNYKNIFRFLLFIIFLLLIIYSSFDNLYEFIFYKLDFNKIINKKTLNEYIYGIKYSKPVFKESVIEDDKVIKPIIYIYNTHQTEEYLTNTDYGYKPNVLHASLIFQNRLKKNGIMSIVEKNSIVDILNANNWNYKNSYKASRILAQNAINNNPEIEYIIDLHRDSIPESSSYCYFNDKKYARIMLVISAAHENYEYNLNLANRINNYLKEYNENLSRGIDIKKYSGLYNQDLSFNAILIEVGSEYNDLESVANSIEILANVYKRIIDEENKE